MNVAKPLAVTKFLTTKERRELKEPFYFALSAFSCGYSFFVLHYFLLRALRVFVVKIFLVAANGCPESSVAENKKYSLSSLRVLVYVDIVSA
ncbi:MAG: hypothetical protein L3K26_15230, partial [Candidatus Hydrogenedentes bacterium]|nr:hypothetical protein [Candidatus Hydrogenedentota bacterium]